MDTRDLRLAQITEPRQVNRTPTVSSATGLSPLTPFTLLPDSYSRHTQRINALKQVREIQVSVHESGQQYQLTIHGSSRVETNIPTMQLQVDMRASAPDNTVEKAFNEFTTLRDDVYSCAKSSHVSPMCDFCSEVVRCLNGAVQPSSLITRALPKEKRARVLNDFLKVLLQLATVCPMDIRQTCRCQEQIPRLLHKFFFGGSSVD
ncbi:hypothetical protein P3T76_012545 [Phytophthora citrophthora]|uniref:Uncharacterized protein n=1 Tax=Phytophthora citrophthora TaxID=4793 RepID=A0AAD9LD55_9STRA|nr:hypothetical protein P3T76_012545 [Phytophthora citrophthora]